MTNFMYYNLAWNLLYCQRFLEIISKFRSLWHKQRVFKKELRDKGELNVLQGDPKQPQSSFSNRMVEILLLHSVRGGYVAYYALDHLNCRKALETTLIGLPSGRCGSVLVRLIPAPRGTGIVSAPVPKKLLLLLAGVDDCYTSTRECTATLFNFAKGTFNAISKTCSYLTFDLCQEPVFTKSLHQEFTDHLVKTHTIDSSVRDQAMQDTEPSLAPVTLHASIVLLRY
ncbi:hypothetical protein U0070_012473 [Myodes glareolus]|uniref:Small ribosomal subunit protein uS5 n=1 Tax=Myodes glareolus TaxID=447135 RepID=A0AAW0H9X3_MYOGA